MTERPAFNPQLHAAMLANRGLAPRAVEGLTHYTDSASGRTRARCGATGGVRLSLNWALVSCPDCRTIGAAPAPTPKGLFPVGYSYRLGGKLHTVLSHQEMGYGLVGHEVDCDGVKCVVAYEYICDNGSPAAG